MGTTVRDVVAEVIARQAPQERQLVEWLGRLDEGEVVRLLKRRKRGDPLGFGLTEVAAVVTPVVWIAVDEAFRGMVGATANSAVRRVAGGVRRRWRRVLRRGPEAPPAMPVLTREQLAAVHRRVSEGAARAGLDEPAALALANCVVARLVLDEPARLPDPALPPALPPTLPPAPAPGTADGPGASRTEAP
ncbi:hypothetical protein OG871_08350 [Kitasatospora sp. NBC_00374]|uniref:hypothetical protein n=1 Tax=Kitasatospora sp. NBC_00374 TaxID=2975964 RepID=UPI0032433D7C